MASASLPIPPRRSTGSRRSIPDSRGVWIAGFSFGAWIGMQLLMRRPEVEGFISIAPQPNLYDFSFLAPCPSSGLIINGDQDKVAPIEAVQGLVDKLKTQKGIVIDHALMKGANHFFEGNVDELVETCANYLDMRLRGDRSRLSFRRRSLSASFQLEQAPLEAVTRPSQSGRRSGPWPSSAPMTRRPGIPGRSRPITIFRSRSERTPHPIWLRSSSSW